jgi:hypothetical protein
MLSLPVEGQDSRNHNEIPGKLVTELDPELRSLAERILMSQVSLHRSFQPP